MRVGTGWDLACVGRSGHRSGLDGHGLSGIGCTGLIIALATDDLSGTFSFIGGVAGILITVRTHTHARAQRHTHAHTHAHTLQHSTLIGRASVRCVAQVVVARGLGALLGAARALLGVHRARRIRDGDVRAGGWNTPLARAFVVLRCNPPCMCCVCWWIRRVQPSGACARTGGVGAPSISRAWPDPLSRPRLGHSHAADPTWPLPLGHSQLATPGAWRRTHSRRA